MGYFDIYQMTLSSSLLGRLTAAAAEEQAAGSTLDPDDPSAWVGTNQWKLVAAPGWGDAWASALAADNPDPGSDPGVITDAMILSQVQSVIAG